MSDPELDRIIEQLQQRRKILDEMIERTVADSAERDRLQKANDSSATDGSLEPDR
jgi:hypothetical protein